MPSLTMPSVTPLNQLLRVDTMVAGGLVVTMDEQRRVIADGAVAIAAGQIVAGWQAGAGGSVI
jgi:glycerol-3-phosphate responsive antiterminator